MPLPFDDELLSLSTELLQQFDAIFGLHPGFRPAHARGMLLTGVFTPFEDAASLTRAPHMTRRTTPVIMRFSNSTGLPLLPDTDPNANPRGCAIRFALGDHIHTDIVSHSTDGFPTRTGQEFLEFLRAVAASGSSNISPSPLETFLSTHPAALAYVQTPKPTPSSFAKEQYFGVTAMRFINSSGESRYGRYRIVPEAGTEHLTEAAAAGSNPSFLFDDLRRRAREGPIGFEVRVQVAEADDVVDDATVHWPEDRPVVRLGRIELTGLMENNEEEQKKIIFDPIPRVDGIEPSDDPLLELRAAVYLLSGRRRRQAPASQAAVGKAGSADLRPV